jgi:hypothetical protein
MALLLFIGWFAFLSIQFFENDFIASLYELNEK